MPIFDHNHPKIIKVIFNFPEFASACKKSSFLSNRQLKVVLDGKSSQEYIQLMLEFLKTSFLILHFSLFHFPTFPTSLILYINDLPDNVICNIAIYADDTTLYSKHNQASDLRQQLELAFDLESDLRDTHVDSGRKWLVGFNARKTLLVLFDWSNKTTAIDVQMNWSVLEEKSSLKVLGVTFSSKLDWGSYIISTAKTASKKIGALVHSL